MKAPQSHYNTTRHPQLDWGTRGHGRRKRNQVLQPIRVLLEELIQHAVLVDAALLDVVGVDAAVVDDVVDEIAVFDGGVFLQVADCEVSYDFDGHDVVADGVVHLVLRVGFEGLLVVFLVEDALRRLQAGAVEEPGGQPGMLQQDFVEQVRGWDAGFVDALYDGVDLPAAVHDVAPGAFPEGIADLKRDAQGGGEGVVEAALFVGHKRADKHGVAHRDALVTLPVVRTHHVEEGLQPHFGVGDDAGMVGEVLDLQGLLDAVEHHARAFVRFDLCPEFGFDVLAGDVAVRLAAHIPKLPGAALRQRVLGVAHALPGGNREMQPEADVLLVFLFKPCRLVGDEHALVLQVAERGYGGDKFFFDTELNSVVDIRRHAVIIGRDNILVFGHGWLGGLLVGINQYCIFSDKLCRFGEIVCSKFNVQRSIWIVGTLEP